MILLAIETTSLKGSIALYRNRNLLAYESHQEKNQHAERILGMIDRCLVKGGIDAHEVERLAVGRGPGGFTGIRVGLSVAAGFQLATKADCVGVSSLASIAANVQEDDTRLRLVILDARRNDFFMALYSHTGKELIPPKALSSSQILSCLLEYCSSFDPHERGELLLFGDVPEEISADFKKQLPFSIEHAPKAAHQPDAKSCALIAQKLDRDQNPLEPLYLRGANAKRPDLPISPLTLPRS